ncbi:DUF3429 domain-containing protein [Glaciecola sp. MH2013]|uniref:DUF3429 domain-containing protein n=1 Tax=Glaciecola sp. MH2013 TaxID=2785524 RepID=UPI00189D409A|nr:DUF3429 domain-containing protein [Glaciecola sp. MH2013]MBF7072671.1 DUF3429 domain-containing protein [Glaciecola sp. MH2013]
MNKQFWILGYAGLLPFIGIPLLAHTDFLNNIYAYQYFVQYSAIILSFFGGIHWYDALQNNRTNHQLYVAMLPSIIAWLSLVFLSGNILLACLSSAFIAILMYDKHVLVLEKQKIIAYTKLRIILTTVVVFSHLAMAML